MTTYTDHQINKAFNRAADEAAELLHDANDGEQVTDACNLTVNLGSYYLNNPDGTIRGGIEESYGEGPEDDGWGAELLAMAGAS